MLYLVSLELANNKTQYIVYRKRLNYYTSNTLPLILFNIFNEEKQGCIKEDQHIAGFLFGYYFFYFN